MGRETSFKAVLAAERRHQRDAQKQLRELERQTKEQAKLSAIEQARLEVETFESGLEVLLSVHKEQGEVWDWMKLATALPPHNPRKLGRHEVKAKLRAANSRASEEARAQDEREFQEATQAHTQEMADWQKMKSIARRILAGEHKAYTEALVEFSALAEISDLGSCLNFTAHSAKLLECRLKVNGLQAIPKETKTLTATGKVTVKPMPKASFHEIYQDYVCSCVLRVAREVFALLPVETALVTAAADALDTRTGQTVEQPVLSVAIPRAALGQLDFDRLVPSDAIENFLHHGHFKASRQTGEFENVTPLAPEDLPQTRSIENSECRDLFADLRRLRGELRAEIETNQPPSIAIPPDTSQSP